MGIGDASGMFPIDVEKKNYDERMIDQFDALVGRKRRDLEIGGSAAGSIVGRDAAGNSTEAGAKLLDSTGTLEAGIPLQVPEGDAGTGYGRHEQRGGTRLKCIRRDFGICDDRLGAGLE